jgi:hypothetical protein
MKQLKYFIIPAVFIITQNFPVLCQTDSVSLANKPRLQFSSRSFFYSIDRDKDIPFLNNAKSDRINLYNLKSDSTNPRTMPRKKEYKVHPVRLAVVGGAVALSWLGMNIYYNHTWWQRTTNYFKFSVDDLHARDVNKVSHVYTSDVIAVGSAMSYEWCGLKPMTAQIFGSLTSLVYETYVEYNDGISPDWGFDVGDQAGNMIGAAWPILQRLVPFLREVNFKWSFKPALIVHKTQNTLAFLDNYDYMTYWLSINPKKLLPKSIGKYYPGFLVPAIGVSLSGSSSHAFEGNYGSYRVWYIALDYDLRYLPGDSDFLKKLKKILNFYHFPSPAIRFSPNGVWYGLYF